jgi:hypothetical protein
VLRLPDDESTVERIIDHIVIPAATYGVAPLTSPPGDATG